MNYQWIIFGIWFVCGFICREVILRHQVESARRRMQADLISIKSRMDNLREPYPFADNLLSGSLLSEEDMEKSCYYLFAVMEQKRHYFVS